MNWLPATSMRGLLEYDRYYRIRIGKAIIVNTLDDRRALCITEVVNGSTQRCQTQSIIGFVNVEEYRDSKIKRYIANQN